MHTAKDRAHSKRSFSSSETYSSRPRTSTCKVPISSCYLFNVSFYFFSTVEHVPPYYAIAGLRKKNGESQNKIMTGLGEIVTAGMNVYDRELEKSWSISFSLFSKHLYDELIAETHR